MQCLFYAHSYKYSFSLMQPLSGMPLYISYIFNIPDNNSSGSHLPMCTLCLAVNACNLCLSEQSDMTSLTFKGVGNDSYVSKCSLPHLSLSLSVSIFSPSLSFPSTPLPCSSMEDKKLALLTSLLICQNIVHVKEITGI